MARAIYWEHPNIQINTLITELKYWNCIAILLQLPRPMAFYNFGLCIAWLLAF